MVPNMTNQQRYERRRFLTALLFLVGCCVVLSVIIYLVSNPPPSEKYLAERLPPDSTITRKLSESWFEVSIEGKPYYAYRHELHYWHFTPKVSTRLVTLDGKFGQIVEDK